MPHIFFSYARVNDTRKPGEENDLTLRDLRWFLDDFAEYAALKLGVAPDQLAFTDRNQTPGTEWPPNITTALAQARTLVALYSPSYFQSEFCGREVQVILDRRTQYIADNPRTRPTNIIPVRWIAGGDSVPIPEFFVSLDAKSTYEKHGLEAVLELVKAGDKAAAIWYTKFKQSLVASVKDAIQRFPLSAAALPLRILDIPNAFHVDPPLLVSEQSEMETGPDSATFVYVGGVPDWEWDPASPCAPPPQDKAGQVSCVVARRNEIKVQRLAFSDNTLGLLDHLNQNNGRVIVMINGHTINQASVRQWLVTYEAKQYKNCATLILGGAAPAAVFPGQETRPPELFRHSIFDADSLTRALHSSLGALKPAIIKTSTSQRPVPATPPGFQSPPVIAGSGPQ